MNFGFNEEQELLRSTARKFFENECPSEIVRTLMDDARGHDARALGASSPSRAGSGLIVPEALRRHGPRPRRPGRAHGGDGPRGGAGARTSPRVLLGRPRHPRGGQRGAEEGVAAADRLGRQARDPRLDGAERDARRPQGVTLDGDGEGGRLRAQRHQALRPRRAHRRRDRRGGAHARRARRADGTGISLFLAAPGHARRSRSRSCPPWTRPASSARWRSPTSRSAPRRSSAPAGAGWAPLARVLDRATVGALRRDVRRAPRRSST